MIWGDRMQSLKLVNGDIQFDEHGELIMVDGDEELAQCCEIALGTNKGEWFLNPEMGIDFRLFLGKSPNEEVMRDELARGLLQEDRIESLDDATFDMNRTARIMTVSFTATGTNGETIRQEGVNIGAG